jgi:hypothetical protein
MVYFTTKLSGQHINYTLGTSMKSKATLFSSALFVALRAVATLEPNSMLSTWITFTFSSHYTGQT